jgi:hypothetical protein
VESEGTKKIARRDLLRAAAGLTAAGAIVGVPALVLSQRGGNDSMSGAAATNQHELSLDQQPLVAYVQDAANGEVVLMAGIDQVVIVDHDLVHRLLSAGKV